MEFITEQSGTETTVKMQGRLDTPAAGQAEKALEQAWSPQCSLLVVDMEEVAYICSAGLRVFLKMQKKINTCPGTAMVLRHCKPVIQEVFEMTGFSGILTLEE